MSQVLEWVKANVFIVVFGLLMVAGLVALPILSAGMNEGVKDLVNKRAKTISQLKSLDKTEVKPPEAGLPVEGQLALVNQALLDEYGALATEMRDDADEVIAAALEFNRKNHTIFMESVLPSMPPRQAEVLPKPFHARMVAMYDGLLNTLKAGVPPTAAELAAEIKRAEINFIAQSVQKDARSDLDEEELAELTKKLTSVRLAKNIEHAEGVGMYLDRNIALDIEGWNQANIPGEPYMFNWNWEYWVVHDVLMALHHANESADASQITVLRGPVKRVLLLRVNDLPVVDRSTAAPAQRGGGGGRAAGGGNVGGSGADDDDGASTATPLNPSAPIAPDYALRFTGRATNPLYDVLEVDLSLIVDSTRIPQVLDAIAGENFFTITSLSVVPVDSFQAARQGFMYGKDPVCQIDLIVETVWLRQWTSERMPDQTRAVLGIPLAQPEPETTDS